MADFKSAVDNYRAAISRNNESVAPYRRLAKLLRELERFDEAEAVYESWLKIDPDSAIAKHFLAVCRGENLSRASSEYINQLFNEDFAVK
ncbi:MAG: tetratricopeptide repeat protein, partial [Phycisphaerae bacterium]|nr:tetratricopeptide repeat protein [Phycisphaerae bacterium]NIP54894.1 tetratricopeptide repeat protein [Phycisphaerae bacterium]NIU11177.1 tetratricopeptide repeat protein [Phycisphaerae bacterium]NIX01268.1 tetratricopeptide repeat protein [Phycisphaerae bacterium]NIX30964.1 tetratricopeptide repeat protein [Phycisphaerae bacterium]